MVILGGSVGIILFGFCVEPLGGVIDSLIQRAAHALLGLIRRPTSERRLAHAKLLAGLLFCHGYIAIIAGIVSSNVFKKYRDEGWTFFDCYYFGFVTFSSIGFGDFAVGPTDNSPRALSMVLVQAVTIFFGMAFFNSFAGVSGEWAEARYVSLTSCRPRFVACLKRRGEDNEEATTEAAEVAADEASEKNGDGKENEAEAEGLEGGTGSTSRVHACKAVIRRATSTIRSTSWLALYIIMIVAGGYTFFNIEAAAEATEAQALRDKENSIRMLAGMPSKGVFAQPEASSGEVSSDSDEDPGRRRFLTPTTRRLQAGAQTAESVRAELIAVSEMSEEDQAAAVEGIAKQYTTVVDHEQGCDQYADLIRFMLDNCKQAPPDPVSLNWSFNGAVFFMMTVMTTIGYGTFAPSTVAGKFVVVSVGYISLVVFGIHLGAIGAEIEALVEWEAEMMLIGISWLEKRIQNRCGRAPDLDGSKSRDWVPPNPWC